MSTPATRSRVVDGIGLLGIGGLLLVLAAMIDPIGSSPDTGVLDLGSGGTRWLLGVCGALFAAAGVVSFLKAKRRQ
ncbi:MAG: hypothetical protein ABI411_07580 [Tahibacter sp.]